MPTIVAQDDVIIRTAQVILDPNMILNHAAFADYYHVDIPEFDDWVARVRARCRTCFRLIKNGAGPGGMLATLDDADGVICESLTIGAAELAEAPKLKIVHNFGTDTRNIDLRPVRRVA